MAFIYSMYVYGHCGEHQRRYNTHYVPPKKLHTLTSLYSIMDTLNTVYSVILIHCRRSGKSLSLISYGKLYHVMTTPIVLYINAKPMGFSRVHCTVQ